MQTIMIRVTTCQKVKVTKRRSGKALLRGLKMLNLVDNLGNDFDAVLLGSMFEQKRCGVSYDDFLVWASFQDRFRKINFNETTRAAFDSLIDQD